MDSVYHEDLLLLKIFKLMAMCNVMCIIALVVPFIIQVILYHIMNDFSTIQPIL